MSDKSDKITSYESSEVPRQIKIGQYKYAYKKNLKNDKYSYRCIHRKCPVLMTISKNQISKLKDNNILQSQITVEYLNKHDLTVHKTKETTIENTDNITLTKTSKELGENLLKASLNKPL